MRMVQDFQAINQNRHVDKYYMRDVQECIDEIGRMGSKIFSTINLTSGFWQMMLNPECRKYTAFRLPGLGQFEWNASPKGLLGAPGSFQRLMEIVIHNLTNILAYIDDLLVHTKDHNKHLVILKQLFICLRKRGLKINLPKSFFGAVEVSYLGFRLTPQGITPGTDKLKAVADAKPPNDVHEVRQFLGLCNFFRGHVRNFAQITAPLNALAHWIRRYGIPVKLITDQGKEFCNKLSDELFKLMEMKHGRTSAYHPQCNSQAEVANKTIAKYLRNVVNTTTLDWEAYLALLMFSYNTSFHRTIQTSLYFLTFGQMARQPAFNQGDWQKKYLGETTAAEKFQILQQARQIAWQNSSHQQELNREVYDCQAEPHNFHKNQWVWLKIENF